MGSRFFKGKKLNLTMRFKNIIFDFDGTLIDSRPGVVKTFKKVVGELASKKLKEKEITQLIGKPLAQIISILLNTNDEALIKKGCGLFQEYYNEKEIYHNILYPGIEEILRLFKKQSLQLFIVSNKIESFIKKILEQHNLKEYFNAILGTDGTDKQSKKPDQIKNLLNLYKLKKPETVMVGDTENDILAAKENSIYSIGVTWGYGSESNLIKAGADTICHTPLELKQFIIKNGKRKTT